MKLFFQLTSDIKKIFKNIFSFSTCWPCKICYQNLADEALVDVFIETFAI